MIVTPEISALSDRTVAISDTVNTPVIDKRSADTVVVTPSDRTVVIGGLISNQTTNTDSKVPLLGDIPLLGHAFKRTIKQNTKTELLDLPRRRGAASTTSPSHKSRKRGKLELKPSTFKPEDVNKFLGEP